MLYKFFKHLYESSNQRLVKRFGKRLIKNNTIVDCSICKKQVYFTEPLAEANFNISYFDYWWGVKKLTIDHGTCYDKNKEN